MIVLWLAAGVLTNGGGVTPVKKDTGALAIGTWKKPAGWEGAKFLFDPERFKKSEEVSQVEKVIAAVGAAQETYKAKPETIRALLEMRRLLDAQRQAYLQPPVVLIKETAQVVQAPAKTINPALIQLIAELL